MSPLKPHLLRALHEWILENGLTPYILVNTELDQVSVPEQFITDGKIILNVHPDAIQDWLMDQECLSFSARFSGQKMSIFIPIAAVLAVYAKENGKGMMFDDDLDSDLNPDPIDPEPPLPPNGKASSKKPSLKVVK